MKTVKELADELGVSKTAVMKKIDNLGLREKLAKNGNRLAIREPEEKLIIEAFSKKESTTANQKPPTKSTTANQKSWRFGRTDFFAFRATESEGSTTCQEG